VSCYCVNLSVCIWKTVKNENKISLNYKKLVSVLLGVLICKLIGLDVRVIQRKNQVFTVQGHASEYIKLMLRWIFLVCIDPMILAPFSNQLTYVCLTLFVFFSNYLMQSIHITSQR